MQHLGNVEIKIRPQHNTPPCQSENNNIIVLGGLVLTLAWDDIQSNVYHNGRHAARLWGDKLEIFKSMITSHQHYHAAQWAVSHTRTRAIIHHFLDSYLHHLMCINVLNREIVKFSIRLTCVFKLCGSHKTMWDVPGMCCCHHSLITPGQSYNRDKIIKSL